MAAHGNSDYKSSYIPKLLEIGERGGDLSEFCAEIGFSRRTVNKWANRYPAFGEALELFYDHAYTYWLKKGEKGLFGNKFESMNGSVWIGMMNLRFRNRMHTMDVSWFNEKDPVKSLALFFKKYEDGQAPIFEIEQALKVASEHQKLIEQAKLWDKVEELGKEMEKYSNERTAVAYSDESVDEEAPPR